MTEILIASALTLAFVNGANDNPKGVATLYGSGAVSYRGALTLATLSTALGSIASVFVAAGLVQVFSAKGLVPDGSLTPAFLAAVAVGASLTVMLATRMGLPISTTHALLGGLAGAGSLAAAGDFAFGRLAALFALPLLASPVLAVATAWLLLRGGEKASRTPAAARVVALDAGRTLNAGHWLSAGLVGFARGVNDTPKILGLLLGGTLLSPISGALLIGSAMALGGLVAARRVCETLAHRITEMTPSQGLAGNLATSLLVIGASRVGVPVSTTHVSTGGIFGVGIAGGALRRRAATQVLAAWLVTLPLAAVISAFTLGVLR